MGYRDSFARAKFSSCIAVKNGARDNEFRNFKIYDTRYAINFVDFDDGFVGSGGDRDLNKGGDNNSFSNIYVDGANNVLVFSSKEIGLGATSNNNKFYNSTFKNVRSVPFISSQTTSGTSFSNCSFTNFPSAVLSEQDGNIAFPLSFSNCTFSNVAFNIP